VKKVCNLLKMKPEKMKKRAALIAAMLAVFLAIVASVTLLCYFQKRHRAHKRVMPMKNNGKIVFTCTTWFDAPSGGKWNSFCAGMRSLLKHHGKDSASTKEVPVHMWLVINEPKQSPASPDWEALMAKKFPWVTFVQKKRGQSGQARSLNLILQAITPFQYWLQWEEAWFCTRPFLHDALAVMQANASITQLQLTRTPPHTDADWYHQRQKGQDDLGWAFIPSTPDTFRNLTLANTDLKVWPAYSLRPSLNVVSFFSALPRFSESASMWPLKFEWDFGRNWVLAGGTKAIFLDAPVTRSAKHVSTYAKHTAARRIVFGLTTIPSRVQDVHKTIDSIFDTVPSNPESWVVLSVPVAYSLRFDGAKVSDAALAALKERYSGKHFHIHRTATDYGPGTKFIGAVEALENGMGGESNSDCKWESIIMLVDDDFFYTFNHFQNFLAEYNKLDGVYAACVSKQSYADEVIGEAFLGLAIPYGRVKGGVVPKMYNAIKNHPEILYHDDVWISYLVTRVTGHAIIHIPADEDGRWGGCYVHSGEVNALWAAEGEFSRENVNKASVAGLQELSASGALAFISDYKS